MSDIEAYLTAVRDISRQWAKAKGQLVGLQEQKHRLLALLFNQAPEGTVASREKYAYSHPEYEVWRDGLAAATEEEALRRWELRLAEWRVDLWRTKEATKRAEHRAYGG